MFGLWYFGLGLNEYWWVESSCCSPKAIVVTIHCITSRGEKKDRKRKQELRLEERHAGAPASNYVCAQSCLFLTREESERKEKPRKMKIFLASPREKLSFACSRVGWRWFHVNFAPYQPTYQRHSPLVMQLGESSSSSSSFRLTEEEESEFMSTPSRTQPNICPLRRDSGATQAFVVSFWSFHQLTPTHAQLKLFELLI